MNTNLVTEIQTFVIKKFPYAENVYVKVEYEL